MVFRCRLRLRRQAFYAWARKTKLIVFASTFQQEYILTPYDILSCTFTDDIFHNNRSAFIIVDKALCEQYPQLLKQ